MHNLMKVLTIATIMILTAGLALAENIWTFEKVPPIKDGSGEGSRGYLDCSGAIEVDISSGLFIHNHSNVGAPNNVDYYGCSTWYEGGGEVVYHVVFPGDVLWEVGLSNMDCDLDLAVLDMCDEDLGCLIVANYGVYVSEPYPGEFFFVVDGYYGDACSYTITFETTPYEEPEPLNFCDLIIADVYGTGTFCGNTCDGQNLITYYPDCNYWTENGLEDYYAVWMPAGSSFTVNLSHSVDAAIWLFDACVEPWVCLAAADNEYPGTTETLTYTNSGPERFVYLVIDSYGSSTCGAYCFDFISTTGAIATKAETLSGVKDIFR